MPWHSCGSTSIRSGKAERLPLSRGPGQFGEHRDRSRLPEITSDQRLGQRARFKRPERSQFDVSFDEKFRAGHSVRNLSALTFDVVRPQPPPADALILMSTPAGSDSLFNASIVFPVGWMMSINRLWVRISNCSRDFLSMCGLRSTV